MDFKGGEGGGGGLIFREMGGWMGGWREILL